MKLLAAGPPPCVDPGLRKVMGESTDEAENGKAQKGAGEDDSGSGV